MSYFLLRWFCRWEYQFKNLRKSLNNDHFFHRFVFHNDVEQFFLERKLRMMMMTINWVLGNFHFSTSFHFEKTHRTNEKILFINFFLMIRVVVIQFFSSLEKTRKGKRKFVKRNFLISRIQRERECERKITICRVAIVDKFGINFNRYKEEISSLDYKKIYSTFLPKFVTMLRASWEM